MPNPRVAVALFHEAIGTSRPTVQPLEACA
ncbi:hypothetical protein BCO9919_05638 [Burkholderia cenocepacia]|uniref:Uncharacterized protein n=1 Tax=Burkholderia cenocepacia TaxID=95486 RepID=A0A6J5JPD2_9BURK|nr:hypothetical protein BCO9919_05638 [Burkholderia cenocepacia]